MLTITGSCSGERQRTRTAPVNRYVSKPQHGIYLMIMGMEIVFAVLGVACVVYGVVGILRRRITLGDSVSFENSRWTVEGQEAIFRGALAVVFGILMVCFSIWYDEFLTGFGVSSEQIHQQIKEDMCAESRAKGRKCIFNE